MVILYFAVYLPCVRLLPGSVLLATTLVPVTLKPPRIYLGFLRSGIEWTIGTLLRARHSKGLTTDISWAKAHKGIPGNQAVDKLVGGARSRGRSTTSWLRRGLGHRPRVPPPSTKSGKYSGRSARPGVTELSWHIPGVAPTRVHTIAASTESTKDRAIDVRSAETRRPRNISCSSFGGTRKRDGSWAIFRSGKTWTS